LELRRTFNGKISALIRHRIAKNGDGLENFCGEMCDKYYLRHPVQIGDMFYQLLKNNTSIY